MSAATYAAFARAAQARGIPDPWWQGRPRLQPEPLLLAPARARALQRAAEAIAAVHDELVRLVAAAPALLSDWFVLTRWQRLLAEASLPHWHGIARADVFWTATGPVVCELNCDTPSGQPEAVHLSALAAASAPPGARDANAELGRRFRALVAARAAAIGRQGPLTVAIVFPTEMTEDLAMVALYRDWLQAAGHRVVLGSPFNVVATAGDGVRVFDDVCDVVVRHYKTDWWCERLPVRDDEPFAADCAPLAAPLLALLRAEAAGRVAVVNPFGAVLPQNKRALAFCWEERARFSPGAQRAIERFLPPTFRLEHVRDPLWAQRADWVLKSDYGCEGGEVVVGRDVDQATWEDALAHAIAPRWVAQRWFGAEADAEGAVVNHGVYLVAGRGAGWFLRRHPGNVVTDAAALCVPALLAAEDPA